MTVHLALDNVGFESLQSSDGERQMRRFGRVRPQRQAVWLGAVEALLRSARDQPWDVDISRQYFLRGEKLMWGWRVIFQGDQLSQHIDGINAVVLSARPAVQQLEEVPLSVSPNRNQVRNGKGAQPTGSAVVGPMAKARMGM